MVKDKSQLDEELLMQTLKKILLYEDREELAKLRAKVEDDQYLATRLTPFIEQRLDFFKTNFSEEYKTVVDKLIEQRIKDSKDELLEVLYPELGKMIKKFISHQFQMLKESIESQIKTTFSSKGFFGKFMNIFPWRRRAMAEEILSNIDKIVIEEVYVIQRDSGLLLGHASQNDSLNQDLIAGMLTAIKAFVEDAFRRKSQDLEMIEYGSYKIFIQSFHSYYLAVAMTGSLSAMERDKLSSDILDFASKELSLNVKEVTSEVTDHISEKLNVYFFQSLKNNNTEDK